MTALRGRAGSSEPHFQVAAVATETWKKKDPLEAEKSTGFLGWWMPRTAGRSESPWKGLRLNVARNPQVVIKTEPG